MQFVKKTISTFQDPFTSSSFKSRKTTSDSMELMPIKSTCSTPPSSSITHQHHNLPYGHSNVGRTSSTSSMMAPLEASTIMMKTSSSAATTTTRGATSEERLLDHFGSIDSSDTFLSCGTHPFPSQGSLAGLEQLAAVGSMAANGSMASIHIPGFNNQTGMYMHINPFDPPSSQRRSHKYSSNNSKQYTSKAEELNERRRVRMNLQQRSMSTDVDFPDDNGSDSGGGFSNSKDQNKTYNVQNNLSMKSIESQQASGGQKDKMVSVENFASDIRSTTTAPKHKRARVSQVGTHTF